MGKNRSDYRAVMEKLEQLESQIERVFSFTEAILDTVQPISMEIIDALTAQNEE